MAMYKVNTGQEGTAFEQLEVRHPHPTPTRQRTPLPFRKPEKTPSPPEQHRQRDNTQTSTNSIEYDVILSTDGPVMEVTTPRSNRLRRPRLPPLLPVLVAHRLAVLRPVEVLRLDH